MLVHAFAKLFSRGPFLLLVKMSWEKNLHMIALSTTFVFYLTSEDPMVPWSGECRRQLCEFVYMKSSLTQLLIKTNYLALENMNK